jgi:nicotinamidase-related amidase
LAATLPSVATVELHNKTITLFQGQLSWKPRKSDDSLVPANRVFIKHGYLPPADAIAYLNALDVERVLFCGIQTDTCILAAGFALFDA